MIETQGIIPQRHISGGVATPLLLKSHSTADSHKREKGEGVTELGGSPPIPPKLPLSDEKAFQNFSERSLQEYKQTERKLKAP